MTYTEQSVQNIHGKGLKEENSNGYACVTWFATLWDVAGWTNPAKLQSFGLDDGLSA